EILFLRSPQWGVFNGGGAPDWNDPTETQVWVHSLKHLAFLDSAERGTRSATATAAENHSFYAVTLTAANQLPRTFVFRNVDEGKDKPIGELPSVAESPGFTP